MGLEKCLPGGLALSLGRRLNPMLPENVSDRRIAQGDAKILQRALNMVVSPGGVLLRHL